MIIRYPETKEKHSQTVLKLLQREINKDQNVDHQKLLLVLASRNFLGTLQEKWRE